MSCELGGMRSGQGAQTFSFSVFSYSNVDLAVLLLVPTTHFVHSVPDCAAVMRAVGSHMELTYNRHVG
jgi:hypothetical protein